MAKKDKETEMTMEEYLLSQLDTPVILKDGSTATKADGSPMTKQEAIATNILNLAMKGDVKASSQTDLSYPDKRDCGVSQRAKKNTNYTN